MPTDLNTVVQRMIAAGEPEENIALVIRSYKASAPVADAPKDWSARLGLREGTSNPTLGFARGAGTALVDMAEGAASGAASTIYQGGDLLRRGLGMDRIIDRPDVQQAMHAPENLQGSIGRGAEQMAEFALPLSRVSKAVATASLPARMAAEGAASAGIAGVQSGGDRRQMATAGALGAAGAPAVALIGAGARLAGRAAAGAAEGGVGGALASVVRNAAPPPAKAMLVQALKPSNARVGFTAALDRAMPELNAVATEAGKPIQSIDDLLEATKAAKLKLRAQYDAMAGPQRAMGSTVDLSPVADARVASIPTKLKLENPRAAAALVDQADAYRKRFPLEQAEQLLKETNAELDAYYKKFPQVRGKAELANPETAHLVAQAKELRTAIYSTLDNPAQGAAAREVQRRYGSLLEVEDVATRRANVAARQQPESLSQQIGKVRAAGQMAKGVWRLSHGDFSGAADIAGARAGSAMADYLKEQQTTNTLIKRAFQGFRDHPAPIPMPQRRPVAGLLERGAIPMQAAPDGSFVRSVPGMREAPNPQRMLPEAQPPRRVFEMPGDVAPDASAVGSKPAAPIAYSIDPTVTVKAGGVRVAQFSGDPKAARAAMASPEVRGMLQRMLEDLRTFEPVRGKLIRSEGSAVKDFYSHGAAGSPVADDIRVISEQHVGNAVVKRAIKDLLGGKPPTNRLHTAALDAAMGYLEKRPGYVGPSVPAAAGAADDGFEAFSRSIDALGKEP